MSGCPFVENTQSVTCFTQCKAERLKGQRKICSGSQYDPLPLTTVEVVPTGLTDEEGNELFEVYKGKEYIGSCYASSEREARSKASTDHLIELVG